MDWLQRYTDIGPRQPSTFDPSYKHVPVNERHMIQVHFPDAVQLIDRVQNTRTG